MRDNPDAPLRASAAGRDRQILEPAGAMAIFSPSRVGMT
jgi:hypothetical protein